MKGIRVTPFVALGLFLSWPGPVFAQNPQSPQQPASRQRPIESEPHQPNQDQAKTFAGKIARSNGKYILQDLSSTVSYVLDDQREAKKYAGKVVLVTGVLDSSSNTIRVKKIETAA